MLIVKSKAGTAGEIKITVSSEGLSPANTSVTAE
jgi:hypothetical protein